MKAVILCAGKSTRTYPITVNKPKPLLRLADKTLIEHSLDRLKGIVKEAILVVSDNRIKKKLGYKYGKIGLKYVKQKETLGTGHALLQAERHVRQDDKFLVLMGDNLYPRDKIKECVSFGISMLGQKVESPGNHGVLEIKRGYLVGIKEKPDKPKSNMVSTGLFVFNERIFGELKSVKPSRRKEYEIPDAVNRLALKVRIRCFYTRDYIPIVFPWDILKANRRLLSEMKGRREGKTEKHVEVKGTVRIGKGTVIKSGTYIEGPVFIGKNCVIGPNAYIRPYTTIGDKVRLRGEVVDSLIMDNTTAKHSCYIGHSVIGEKVNIAAGTVTADYRHDGKSHSTPVKGKTVDTGMRKLGAFIGDDVRTGINTSIYPGRKIWPGLTTLLGDVVKEDRVK